MDFTVALKALPLMLQGAKLTVVIAVAVLGLGTLWGLLVALLRMSHNPVISGVAGIYNWLLRGTPALIVLFFTYFGLPYLGLNLTPLMAAILGLTLHDSAYLAEIIRSGIQSVAPGQWEGARSLGLGHTHTLFRIVLPQALHAIVPPYITQATESVKNSALASVITVPEVTQVTYSIMASNYRAFEMFTLLAVIFMVINGVLLGSQPVIERRMALKR